MKIDVQKVFKRVSASVKSLRSSSLPTKLFTAVSLGTGVLSVFNAVSGDYDGLKTSLMGFVSSTAASLISFSTDKAADKNKALRAELNKAKKAQRETITDMCNKLSEDVNAIGDKALIAKLEPEIERVKNNPDELYKDGGPEEFFGKVVSEASVVQRHLDNLS